MNARKRELADRIIDVFDLKGPTTPSEEELKDSLDHFILYRGEYANAMFPYWLVRALKLERPLASDEPFRLSELGAFLNAGSLDGRNDLDGIRLRDVDKIKARDRLAMIAQLNQPQKLAVVAFINLMVEGDDLMGLDDWHLAGFVWRRLAERL